MSQRPAAFACGFCGHGPMRRHRCRLCRTLVGHNCCWRAEIKLCRMCADNPDDVRKRLVFLDRLAGEREG